MFCALVVVIGAAVTILSMALGQPSPAAIFAIFLPLCFVFVGSAVSELRQENLRLRRDVAALQERVGIPSSAAPASQGHNLPWQPFRLVLATTGLMIVVVAAMTIATLWGVMRSGPVNHTAPAAPVHSDAQM